MQDSEICMLGQDADLVQENSLLRSPEYSQSTQPNPGLGFGAW